MGAVEVGVGYNGDIDVLQDWKRPLFKQVKHFGSAHFVYDGLHPGLAEDEKLANDFIINERLVREVLLVCITLDDHGKAEGQWEVSRPSNELFREGRVILRVVEMSEKEVDGVPV